SDVPRPAGFLTSSRYIFAKTIALWSLNCGRFTSKSATPFPTAARLSTLQPAARRAWTTAAWVASTLAARLTWAGPVAAANGSALATLSGRSRTNAPDPSGPERSNHPTSQGSRSRPLAQFQSATIPSRHPPSPTTHPAPVALALAALVAMTPLRHSLAQRDLDDGGQRYPCRRCLRV